MGRANLNLQSTQSTNRRYLPLALLVVYAVLAAIIIYLVYTGVSNFVAAWNITDLPGIVVSDGPTPTPGSSEGPVISGNPLPPVDNGPEPQPWDGASRVNVLVMGLDYRDWITGEGAPRTDTMMLFSIDPISQTAGMLSIPRDLWVSIPGFEEPNRINVAYRFGETYELPGGGPALAMKTVEALLGLKIDYYALIDFYAFERFIDELGGIKVNVPDKIRVDPIVGKDVVLEPGNQVLPGNLALAYARARNSEGGDFDRGTRQQQVIMGIRNRVVSSDTLPLLIRRAPQFYAELSAGVHTNLSLETGIKLAWLAKGISEENIKRGVIGPGQINFGKSPEGDDVLKPRPEQIRILRDEIFTASGPASPAMANSDSQELMQAENASISVLNGSGIPGLASRTADYLKAAGANVVETSDAPEPYTYTTLISYNGNPYTVKYLVELMGIAPNKIYNRYDPSSPVEFALFLGYDWANNNAMP